MLPVSTSLGNLLSKVESWTHGSKALIVVTLFIFAAIPLTVIGVFSMRSFTPTAAVSVPSKLSPEGSVQTSAPVFTWECDCDTTKYRVELRENDSNFSQGSWQKDVEGKSGVNTTRYGGWTSLNYQEAPSVLKTGTSYYWTVTCLSGNCQKPTAVSFTVSKPDTEKPTVPSGLQIVSINTASFNLIWNKSTDDNEVVGYQILSSIGNSTQSQIRSKENVYTYSPYTGSETYTFSIAATDAAGNVSDFSPKITFKAPDKDSDKDVFLDSQEIYFGTDPKIACKGHWSWPPDMNDDGTVDSLDTQTVTKNIGLVRASVNSTASRYDLNQSGVVDQGDVNKVSEYLGKSC